MKDEFKVAGTKIKSRLIVGTGKYKSFKQTAEAIKKDGHPEWMQVVGLIHDIGKIIFKWGCDEDGTSLTEQWSIVGDTFVVGCQLPDELIYPELNELAEQYDKNGL